MFVVVAVVVEQLHYLLQVLQLVVAMVEEVAVGKAAPRVLINQVVTPHQLLVVAVVEAEEFILQDSNLVVMAVAEWSL
jgi:hypothetical protein